MKKFENEAVRLDKDSKELTRENRIYKRNNDIRSEFSRDYTRIIFSQAYRRLKHKTQVFFAPENDHVCTRIEHVNLVESVSFTIAKHLGLNTELTKAISAGHDLGHAPFGHGGEKIISSLAKNYGLGDFWHEKNSLHLVDSIETLQDDDYARHNLNLTYAVRDGIISHCGEVNQESIIKRDEYIDLNEYQHAGQYQPYTWEGCVVKMSDKIAYLARDIEDALRLDILTKKQIEDLKNKINNTFGKEVFSAINNGTVVNYFILDVCDNSSPSKGICLSSEAFKVMKMLMEFNYKNIYLIDRVKIHSEYVELIIKSIFNFILRCNEEAVNNDETIINTLNKYYNDYPKLIGSYSHWLIKYSNFKGQDRPKEYQNKVLYDFEDDDKAIIKSMIDFLSGMSDAFLLQSFNELVSF